MKKLLISAMVTGFLLVPVLPSVSSETGLKADVYAFDGEDLPTRDPLLYPLCENPGVITESQTLTIENVGAGVVAGCRENFVLVRLTGSMSLAPGNYTFTFNGDDGIYLKVGNTVLTNDEADWILKGSGGSVDVPLVVTSSAALPVDFWFFEYGGGAFAEVIIRDSQNQIVDQSNIFSPVFVNDPAPTSASADGPVGLRLVETKRTCEGSSWSLLGDRLNFVSEIKVGGIPVAFNAVSNEKLTFEAPSSLAPGKHKVSYFVGAGKATELVGTITLKKEASCSSTLLRYSGLQLGQPQLGPSNAADLSAFLKSSSAAKKVVCTGSAVAWESNDPKKLALQRAEGACRLIKQALPGVSVESRGFVSRLMSSSYQAVAVRISR